MIPKEIAEAKPEEVPIEAELKAEDFIVDVSSLPDNILSISVHFIIEKLENNRKFKGRRSVVNSQREPTLTSF